MHHLRPEIPSYRQTYFIVILIPGFVVTFLLSALIIGICPVFPLFLKERRGVVE
jgi:hypothetical protein